MVGPVDIQPGTPPQNCPESRQQLQNLEGYEGDMDQHFDTDHCRDLLQRLSYSTANHDTNNPPDHKIPVDGDIRTGSGTLKSTAKLYAEFRQRQFLSVHRP